MGSPDPIRPCTPAPLLINPAVPQVSGAALPQPLGWGSGPSPPQHVPLTRTPSASPLAAQVHRGAQNATLPPRTRTQCHQSSRSPSGRAPPPPRAHTEPPRAHRHARLSPPRRRTPSACAAAGAELSECWIYSAVRSRPPHSSTGAGVPRSPRRPLAPARQRRHLPANGGVEQSEPVAPPPFLNATFQSKRGIKNTPATDCLLSTLTPLWVMLFG